MPLLLSFDIGITNLAYCLFSTDTSSILIWGIIDTISQLNTSMAATTNTTTNIHRDHIICAHSTPAGKRCTSAAKMIDAASSQDTGFIGYCQRHSYKYESNINLVPIKSNTCCAIGCSKRNVYCHRSNYYVTFCTEHYKESALEEADFLQIKKKKKTTNINLTDLARAIYTALDAQTAFLTADVVLLENQPVLKNPTMKSIQIFLYAYFVMKLPPTATITCYTASNKLALRHLIQPADLGMLDAELAAISDKYRRNKRAAIWITGYLLGAAAPDVWNAAKKKDDLADCYLMIRHYLSK
jgi:hypothetical protein